MALLTAQQKFRVRTRIGRELSELRERADFAIPDLEAAIDIADQKVEAMIADLAATLPEPFKSAATRKQKLRVLRALMDVKFGDG